MTEMQKSLAVFSGSTNPQLAEAIAASLGISLGNVKLEKFANGEIYARYLQSVRGSDVFIVQSVAGSSVNDALMETLIMADAARRASARTITAVLSHYGYSRQDRKAAAREPITAKLVANLLQTSGVQRVMSIDLHQGQIQGFFDIPVDHLTALPILADYFKAKNIPSEDLCVVSPDVGRAKAAKKLSDMMQADLAIMHKGRPGHNRAEITALIGDVQGKVCILNDDMIDTGGSVVAAVSTLRSRGAKDIYVCATHPVFSGPGLERMANLDVAEVVVCDTIPVPLEYQTGKIKVVSVAPLFAHAISNVFSNGSVSELFDPDFAL
ncbi:ribose-phosphate pyrophosphokinase [Eggerthellaceae bacterium zg-1084]|uniref:Ribose-phosphate pyrophosphokinase n=1 Tax=Berryella wangjianweii TaxID=2734634 RepID=A0A6M8J8H3_9ACTN|nr:ribose-phosphate pyrophosphokinase [Berryella wangjianweii]NPD31590.1 ribose-phosphate pyrophosphokinase [Berryella wangjianweii]NPD32915.1 ribose-phosphate pyrophosphokinase [Eggerthellaceae bacterium zg-997]QKF07788.1 ribose-phosphate pyrophosphokinase [Berryella wangjianweii]